MAMSDAWEVTTGRGSSVPARDRANRVNEALMSINMHFEVGYNTNGKIVIRLDETDARQLLKHVEDHSTLMEDKVEWVR